MDSIVSIMKKVAEHEAQRIFTTELGLVTAVFPHKDDGDTENYQCSVKLKNRKQPDGTDFELRKVPIATPYIGLVCIPNVDDLVLINFISGDINSPVITGRLYNETDRPPVNLEKEFLLKHSLKEGGSIKVDAEGKILITSKDEKNVFTLQDEKIAIENEKFSLIIDISGEKITILSDKDMALTAKSGKLEIEANEITIKSKKALTIDSGDALNIKSAADTKVEAGGALNIKSSADAKVEAGGAMKLKGTSIDLN